MEVKSHRDTKPGSRAVLYPVFRLSLTKAKMGMIWILTVRGKVQGEKKTPNQEIKVKQGLSRVITPKLSTVQNGTKSGRLGKCL